MVHTVNVNHAHPFRIEIDFAVGVRFGSNSNSELLADLEAARQLDGEFCLPRRHSVAQKVFGVGDDDLHHPLGVFWCLRHTFEEAGWDANYEALFSQQVVNELFGASDDYGGRCLPP